MAVSPVDILLYVVMESPFVSRHMLLLGNIQEVFTCEHKEEYTGKTCLTWTGHALPFAAVASEVVILGHGGVTGVFI